MFPDVLDLLWHAIDDLSTVELIALQCVVGVVLLAPKDNPLVVLLGIVVVAAVLFTYAAQW